MVFHRNHDYPCSFGSSGYCWWRWHHHACFTRPTAGMVCRCTSMLMTVRCTAFVCLMPLPRCRLQCHNVSTASPALIASNSTPTRRRWCGARPPVSCHNFPRPIHWPLLALFFFLSAPFETWECLSTAISERLNIKGDTKCRNWDGLC